MRRSEINHEQVVLGALTDDLEAESHELLGHRSGHVEEVLHLGLELGRLDLHEVDVRGEDLAEVGSTLKEREDRAVDARHELLEREDDPTARPVHRLVRRHRDELHAEAERVGVEASGHQPSDVSDVREDDRADAGGEVHERSVVGHEVVRREADHDHIGLEVTDLVGDVFHVDRSVFAHRVGLRVEEQRAARDGRSVGEVADGHLGAEDPQLAGRFAGVLEALVEPVLERDVHSEVGVGAAPGLHVGADVGGRHAEHLHGLSLRGTLELVDVFASLVVAIAGLTFPVLVVEDGGAGGLHLRALHLFRRDQHDLLVLPEELRAREGERERDGPQSFVGLTHETSCRWLRGSTSRRLTEELLNN